MDSAAPVHAAGTSAAPASHDGMLASRQDAVDALLRGSLVTVAAAGVFGLSVTGLLGSASLPLALGSVAIGGLGVVKLATAARHFLRFGYRSTVTILGSVGVLGAVVAAWPVLMALDLMGVWQIPAALREVYPIVLVGAGLVALFLTLRAVLAWVLEPPGRTPIDDDVEPMEDARER